jgi:hypothetical protein
MELFANNATSTLLSAINNVVTAIPLQVGHGARFPAMPNTSGDYYWATLANADSSIVEIVRVDTRSGDTLNVARGQQGTTAVAWSAGDKVEMRLTAASLNLPDPQAGRRALSYFTDFEGVNAAGTIFSTSVASGTVANTTALETGNRIGVLRLDTGAVATGRAGLITDINTYRCDSGSTWLETMVRIPTLSNATQRFSLRLGLIDSASADSTDGVYFEYDDSLSANWRLCTANNAVRTKTNGADAVVASSTTMTRLAIVVTTTNADFFVNGLLSGSVTTNIPTTRSMGMGITLIKSIGTTARQVDIDMWHYKIEFAAAR